MSFDISQNCTTYNILPKLRLYAELAMSGDIKPVFFRLQSIRFIILLT